MRLSTLIITTSLCAHAFAGSRQFELLIYRNITTSECSFASLQETQIFKGLSDQGYSHVYRTSSVGEERLRFIEQHPEQLWPRIHSLCGLDSLGTFPLIVGDSVSYTNTYNDATQDALSVSIPQQTLLQPLQLEVQPLISSGRSDNRVDLVFFSDGYTLEEKDKFIADANRLAMDISGNQTFNTVKPLMNFWAAFAPSKESGIGIGGVPKDTPFGLYRDGTELRGVYYSKPEVARAACLSLGDKCDYPILMGNDPLYGGLGGDFTVITPSLANGALVLRHELGHSIIEVGEEYDGGPDYFGVNAAQSVESVSWTHWFTEPSHSLRSDAINSTEFRVERSVMPMQAYPWTMLNTTDPWSVKFNSSGTYSRHLVRFSLSGLPDKNDLHVELDGNDLLWTPRQDIGVDRWHYDVHRDGGLDNGEHEVKFTLMNSGREGVAQLCSVEVLEFGDEKEFIATPGYHGVFPTFSDVNETSYRPTNEDCLMRIVTTPNFCRVCLEGLWLSLLRRVDLIENLRAGCTSSGSSSNFAEETEELTSAHKATASKRSLELDLVPLAQFREDAVDVEESYTITWMKDHEVLEAFTNKTRLEVDDNELALGTYTVDVRFTTPEVRVDKNNLLTARREYEVLSRCGA